jgi:hypothetical protein
MDPDPWICYCTIDTGSCSFRQDFQDGNKKQKNFLTFFCLLHSVGIVPSVHKDNMSLRSYKTAEINVFLLFLHVDSRSASIQKNTDPDPGCPKKMQIRIRNIAILSVYLFIISTAL